MYWLGSSGGTPWDRLGGALPVEEESSGPVLGVAALEGPLVPLEPRPSATLPWSPPPPPIPLLMWLKWLMLLLTRWAEGAGADEKEEPDRGVRELTLLSTLV